MESDLYIALARADEQSFRAEWNLAASLNIPAFGYVCGPVESAFRPAPRHVESEAQLLGLLACDLYYYT
jgi:hypothetical protein